VADVWFNFDGAPDLEFRLATTELELERFGLGYLRIPPGSRFRYGHMHKEQEEVCVLVGGSGRMKLEDEIVDVERWEVVRVAPGTWRGAADARDDGGPRLRPCARRSSKTVEGRLSRTYTQLGIASRAELPDALATAPRASPPSPLGRSWDNRRE
jgi:hypothetical protein